MLQFRLRAHAQLFLFLQGESNHMNPVKTTIWSDGCSKLSSVAHMVNFCYSDGCCYWPECLRSELRERGYLNFLSLKWKSICILSEWKYSWVLSIFYHVWMWLSRNLPELYNAILVWFLSYLNRKLMCAPDACMVSLLSEKSTFLLPRTTQFHGLTVSSMALYPLQHIYGLIGSMIIWYQPFYLIWSLGNEFRVPDACVHLMLVILFW